jgi:hypothetical protein
MIVDATSCVCMSQKAGPCYIEWLCVYLHVFACTKCRVGIFICCHVSRAEHVFTVSGALRVSECICMYQMLSVYLHAVYLHVPVLSVYLHALRA